MESNLWGEKNLTDRLLNLLRNVGKDNFDTIIEIRNVLIKNGQNDTTVQKKMGIYLIINKVNGKYYVGCSGNVKRRVYEHFYYLKKGIHTNPKLQNAYNYYGESSFESVMFECLDENIESLLKREQLFLKGCETHPTTNYNCRYISTGGNTPDLTVIEKLSQPRGSLKDSTKEKLKVKFLGKRNPNFDKKRTVEEKIKCQHDLTIYNFYNQSTQEHFNGTRTQFIEKYKIYKGLVYKLIKGKQKQTRNWILINREQEIPIRGVSDLTKEKLRICATNQRINKQNGEFFPTH